MDKYIKYPLPIDKSKLSETISYMRFGGFQLIEIMEKEFPFRRLLKEADDLGINFSQLERLFSWIKHNCVVNRVQTEFQFNSNNSVLSFFVRGAGILGRLYKAIDLTPVIVDGQFESRYSFIKYEVIVNEAGIIVASKINEDKWSCYSHDITPTQRKSVERLYCYEKRDDELIRLDDNSDLAKDLKDAYEISSYF